MLSHLNSSTCLNPHNETWYDTYELAPSMPWPLDHPRSITIKSYGCPYRTAVLATSCPSKVVSPLLCNISLFLLSKEEFSSVPNRLNCYGPNFLEVKNVIRNSKVNTRTFWCSFREIISISLNIK